MKWPQMELMTETSVVFFLYGTLTTTDHQHSFPSMINLKSPGRKQGAAHSAHTVTHHQVAAVGRPEFESPPATGPQFHHPCIKYMWLAAAMRFGWESVKHSAPVLYLSLSVISTFKTTLGSRLRVTYWQTRALLP